jgi:hypothetical protein
MKKVKNGRKIKSIECTAKPSHLEKTKTETNFA